MWNVLLISTVLFPLLTSALPRDQDHEYRWHHWRKQRHHKSSPLPPLLPLSSSAPVTAATASRTSPPSTTPASQTGLYIRPSVPKPSAFSTAPMSATVVAPATGIRPSASSKPFSSPNGTVVSSRPSQEQIANVSSPSPAASAASGKPYAGFLRGVNVGGWLLLDSVLNVKLLSTAQATSQWDFDSSQGAAATLSDHWKTYFTESDMQSLKQYGINAINIPIGYWAWDNSGTPYKQGADAYLEAAVGWAAAAGIKVWIDVSNTDTSPIRYAETSPDYALTHSLNILSKIATKYGATTYADTVIAVQIFGCPIGGSDTASSDTFIKQAYSTIRKAAANPNLQVILPDGHSSPQSWISTAQSLNPTQGMVAVSETMNQLSGAGGQQMTQNQYIQQACERGYNIAGLNHGQISIYTGQFNPATNATLYTEGWTDEVVTDVRKYVEANLAVFEAYTSGYFFWSWAIDSEETLGAGWSFKAGMEKGWIPNPLNDRSKFKYPGLCDV